MFLYDLENFDHQYFNIPKMEVRITSQHSTSHHALSSTCGAPLRGAASHTTKDHTGHAGISVLNTLFTAEHERDELADALAAAQRAPGRCRRDAQAPRLAGGDGVQGEKIPTPLFFPYVATPSLPYVKNKILFRYPPWTSSRSRASRCASQSSWVGVG